jgi:hypothetical protein
MCTTCSMFSGSPAATAKQRQLHCSGSNALADIASLACLTSTNTTAHVRATITGAAVLPN